MSFNYSFSDSANLTIKSNTTNNIVLYTPYANDTSLEFSSDQVYANAKGARAVRFDHNKQGKLTTELEVFDLQWISILLGGSWAEGVVDISGRDSLTASATNTIELSATPKTGSLVIFSLKADNIAHKTKQTVGTPATNVDEYSISDTTVTLNSTTAPEGTAFVAYYLKDSESTAETIHIKTNEFPVSYEITGDAMMARKHDNVIEYVQYTLPNAKPLGNITLSLKAGSVTSLSAVFDLFGDENNDMAVITKL